MKKYIVSAMIFLLANLSFAVYLQCAESDSNIEEIQKNIDNLEKELEELQKDEPYPEYKAISDEELKKNVSYVYNHRYALGFGTGLSYIGFGASLYPFIAPNWDTSEDRNGGWGAIILLCSAFCISSGLESIFFSPDIGRHMSHFSGLTDAKGQMGIGVVSLIMGAYSTLWLKENDRIFSNMMLAGGTILCLDYIFFPHPRIDTSRRFNSGFFFNVGYNKIMLNTIEYF